MNPQAVIFGGNGYIGQAFQRALKDRGYEVFTVSRARHDYTRFNVALDILRSHRWDIAINCAAYIGKPNVEACEGNIADLIQANAVLPATIAAACEVAGVRFGHVGTGCVYQGCKVVLPDGSMIRENDAQNAVRNFDKVVGFDECDLPGFTFRSPPCSNYSGSKHLGEEAVLKFPHAWVWRLRIPFDGIQHERNYITKLMRYDRLCDHTNSISHRADFCNACIDLAENYAPFGVYNLTNQGWVSARELAFMIRSVLIPEWNPQFWESEQDFLSAGHSTPRTSCILDCSKAIKAGARLRHVYDALAESIRELKGSQL